MEEQIFIVTRQNFYVSRGNNHAMAMNNPVVGAWHSKLMVDAFFRRRSSDFIERGYTYEHVKEPHSLGTIERYIIKDKDGKIYCTYSVIIEPLI